jgi:hypothetical protein
MGRAVCAFAIAAAVVAGAAGPARAERATVELIGDGVPAWQAQAVAGALAAALEDPRYRAVVVRGALAPGRLTWTIAIRGAIVKHGETELRGTTTRAVAGALASELGRVLVPGDEAIHDVVELPARVGDVEPAALAALAAIAVFLLVPFAAAGSVRRARGLRSLRRTVAVIAGLGGAAAVLVVGRDYEWSWAIFVGGGLAWGGFGAVLIPLMFPALPGLDRVEHTELLGALGRWAVLALQRIAAVALAFAPFMAVLVLACAVLDVPRDLAIAVIAPAWGLCVRLWWQAWVEVLAARLDAALVDGDPTTENPWHIAVRGYLMGYVRRAGWGADDRLVDGIRFLPGTGASVVTYGGGTTHSRVVVPRAMLELALAPYGRPHDYAAPRVSTLHWTLWSSGLVLPSEVGAIMPTREQREPRTVAGGGADGEDDADPTDDAIAAAAIGEPATFAGFVEPDQLDGRPGYRPHEDPLWLDYDAGDEYDGTDAGDKDFLFGALIHELGRIRRHEDRIATLALAVRRRLDRRPGLARGFARIGRALAGPTDAVGDVHVRLNFARDHFAQYLGWRIWHRDDLTTARAFAPELHRQTRALVQLAAGAPSASEAPAPEAWGEDTAAPDLRARLQRVGAAHVASPRARWRRIALAAAALAVAAVAVAAVVRAVDYHATYQARVAPRTSPESKHGQGN